MMIRARPLFVALVVLALASLVGALISGSVPLGVIELGRTLAGGGEDLAHTLVWEVRLPRALSAFAVGAALAIAGALMQALLRNPLADPYILGVSGGGAVGALLALLAGLSGLWLTGAAFAGALVSMWLVFALARGVGTWTPTRLLLTGVVVAAGWGALIGLILALSPDTTLRGMLYWLMGDFSYAHYPWPALLAVTLGLLIGLALARDLNVLARGEYQAQALGVALAPLHGGLYVLASLLTAAAVTTAGSVGFVGLIVPHLVRLVAGSDHRVVLPAAALLGGSLLAVADTLARTVLAPQQLPVGVITALVGVPVFLYLLNRRGSH